MPTDSVPKAEILRLKSFTQAYVSVGPSADFPDQCLVTVGAGSYGGFTQFAKVPGGPPPPPPTESENLPTGGWEPIGNGDVSQLDRQTKDWNATPNSDGSLAFP